MGHQVVVPSSLSQQRRPWFRELRDDPEFIELRKRVLSTRLNA
jgi:hypothetical protein